MTRLLADDSPRHRSARALALLVTGALALSTAVAAGGTASKVTASNGPASNGPASNGPASNGPAASGGTASDSLLDGSNDRIVHRAFIPSERNVHGEARLIRRGDAWVFQTLLQSPQLRRGIQRMSKKEMYAWPEEEPGHEDSERYLTDLEAAKDHVVAELEALDGEGPRALQMLIELILSPTDAVWAFYEIETRHDGSELELVEKDPIVTRRASRTYLRRAFLLQAESAFDDDPIDLSELPP